MWYADHGLRSQIRIPYLFLLADLLCCAAVFTVFYGFYQKNFNENKAMLSIFFGLFLGLMFFPSPDFSTSILVGTLLPLDLFPSIISSSLLFWSFLLATLSPVIVIMNYDSFKGWQPNFKSANCNLLFDYSLYFSFFNSTKLTVL